MSLVVGVSNSFYMQRMQNEFNKLTPKQQSAFREMFQQSISTKEKTRTTLNISPTSVSDSRVLGIVDNIAFKSGVLTAIDSSAKSKDTIARVSEECIEGPTSNFPAERIDFDVVADYKDSSEIGSAQDSMRSEGDSGRVQFANKSEEHEIPGRRQLKKEGRTHLLWKHPSEYQDSQEEVQAEYYAHVERLRELGMEIPLSRKKVLNHLIQPNSTKPEIYLSEID